MIDRVQKYAACFATLRPDDFRPEIIATFHANDDWLADHDILAIIKGFIGF